MEDNKTFGIDLKVILVGDTSTGKTSIINRYIKGTFEEQCRATISPNFSSKMIKKDGFTYRLQCWDIPGQDRNPTLTSIFCRDTQGVVLCCDVKEKKTREDLLKWKNSLESYSNISNLPIIILENKCDLLGKEDNYNDDIEELKHFSEDNNFSGYFRTSALNGYNIENAMDFLISEIIKVIKDNENTDNERIDKNEKKDDHKLTAELTKNDDKKRCC